MALVNLYTLPGLGRATPGFAEIPKFPEFPAAPEASFEGTISPPAQSPEAAAEAGAHFAAILEDAIDAAASQDHAANDLARRAATGEDVDPHQLMVQNAKAEVMTHMASSVATKMAQNVQTIMNMQI